MASCQQATCTTQGGTSIWNLTISNISLPSNISGINASTSLSPEQNLLSQEAQSSLIALYVITIVFSIVGNIMVIIVFTRGRRCRTDIRPFLINLSVADLIMALFCMPFTFTYVMTRTWVFSNPMCPIVLFMQHLSVSASVFTNMAIGIDRFLVVTFPLRARMTTKRARYTICIIWMCSIGLSSVQLIVGRARTYGDVVDCNEQWSSPGSRRTFTLFVLFITYITPLLILSVTYSIVSILLWKRTAPGNAHEGRDLQQLKGKRKVIKMLVLVVVMFGLCWLPLQTFFLVLDFNPQILTQATKSQQRLFTIIYYIVFWLAMSNSCANPIIYGFTNESFRIDLASLCYLWLPFCICLKKKADRQFSVSTLDSTYFRRFGTARKSNCSSGSRQVACKNGNRVYIELHKATSMHLRDNQHAENHEDLRGMYKENSVEKKLSSYHNGRSNHDYNKYRCKRHRKHQKQHSHFCRAESAESSGPFSFHNNSQSECDVMATSLSSTNESQKSTSPVSTSSSTAIELLCSCNDDKDSLVRLNPLHEIEISDKNELSAL